MLLFLIVCYGDVSHLAIIFDCIAMVYLRIGRTARAGAQGQAVTFIEDAERKLLKEVVKKTGVQMQQREVPPVAVQQWQEKVEGSHGDVWRVLKEEREEKEMRQVRGGGMKRDGAQIS